MAAISPPGVIGRGFAKKRARALASLALALLVGAYAACVGRSSGQERADGSFAALVASLSEPGGYFDTDNLITNERSYLHVMPVLERHSVEGGAYLGVGPDQNFSYMAEIRPDVAFLVDIRRDNLLLHLVFKALFEIADNRIEYLALLFGRPVPPNAAAWRERSLAEMVAYVAGTPAVERAVEGSRRRVDAAIREFGLTLSDDDLETIDRFHRTFIDEGPSLKFRSHGRQPRYFYPSYRDLLLETDTRGEPGHYLASKESFVFLKRLQEADAVVPVVGDLAGRHALRAIGRHMSESGLTLSAFYTSNVEFYLARSGTFAAFVENLRALPRDENSVLIRSVFHGVFGPHPNAVPGYGSTQLVHSVDAMLEGWSAGRYRSYWELVTSDILD